MLFVDWTWSSVMATVFSTTKVSVPEEPADGYDSDEDQETGEESVSDGEVGVFVMDRVEAGASATRVFLVTINLDNENKGQLFNNLLSFMKISIVFIHFP